jgi:hypothetical protein
MGGRTHYIISDPTDVAAVHKNGKSLTIQGFVRFIYISIWGFRPAAADRMWELKPTWHRIDQDWLLQQEKNDVIVTKYYKKLEQQLQQLDARIAQAPNGKLNLAGLKAIVDLEGNATVETLYGETTLAENPGLLDDLTVMVRDGFWGLLFRAPVFMYRKPYAARARLISAFGDMVQQINERKDVSDYIRERTVYLTGNGIDPATQGADLLRTMFASLLNSMPTAYLSLLHILKSPGLIDEVRAELTAVGYDKLEPSELKALIPSKLPLLRSIWSETLRVHNNSLTVREVIADTQLEGKDKRTWTLHKGGVVNIPCGLMHYNEALHPDADNYHPRRFMEKTLGGEGENAARTTKPFGGGSTHCPGRVFAEKQMIGVISAVVMRYDLEVTSPGWEIPLIGEFDTLARQKDIFINFSKRQPVKLEV